MERLKSIKGALWCAFGSARNLHRRVNATPDKAQYACPQRRQARGINVRFLVVPIAQRSNYARG